VNSCSKSSKFVALKSGKLIEMDKLVIKGAGVPILKFRKRNMHSYLN
jgi:hypothetical protein